jgi:hypothetical protein
MLRAEAQRLVQTINVFRNPIASDVCMTRGRGCKTDHDRNQRSLPPTDNKPLSNNNNNSNNSNNNNDQTHGYCIYLSCSIGSEQTKALAISNCQVQSIKSAFCSGTDPPSHTMAKPQSIQSITQSCQCSHVVVEHTLLVDGHIPVGRRIDLDHIDHANQEASRVVVRIDALSAAVSFLVIVRWIVV